jgi:hypothetical protein
MISFYIKEVKPFMAKLLTGGTFDNLVLKSMEIQTFTDFIISGNFNEPYFTKEELSERGDRHFIPWSDVRGIAYSIIKGNKTPLTLKLVLQLSPSEAIRLVKNRGIGLKEEEVGGLYMNIRFEKGELHIITGVAIKAFTMDRSLEQAWDDSVRQFLAKQDISFDEE